MENIIDLTGKIFGKLTVIELAHKKQRLLKNKRNGFCYYWKCLCECGKETIVYSGKLKNSHTSSCGCKLNVCGNKNKHWKGVGDMSSHYVSQLKHGAKRRNHEFNITKEYIWDLFLKQDKKCALSGVSLIFATMAKMHDGTASIDRIDSTKGYIEGNVHWVHKDVNMMKQAYSQEYFIEMCKKIAKLNN